ncbi:MAG: hypothetical protein K2N13_03885 [Paraprevotella sp.]|nr:hypothetical protein [Paraprevotella sp.]
MRRLMYLCFSVFILGGCGELKAQDYQVRVVKGNVRMREGKVWTELKQGVGIAKNTVVNVGKEAKLILLDMVLPGQTVETLKEYSFCGPGTLSVERLIAKSSIRIISRTLFDYYVKLLANGASDTGKHSLGEYYTTVVRDADSLLFDVDSLSVVVPDSIVILNDTVVVP